MKIFYFLLIGFFFFQTSCVFKTPPLPTSALSVSAAHEMGHYSDYWIEVQIPQRKLILAKGGRVIRAFSVAVGMPSYPSPIGIRKIDSIVWNPWWNPPPESDWVENVNPVPPRSKDNPLGEIKMPLGEAYLIHGTKAVSSIGDWASHGCIRMLFEDIFSIADLLMRKYSKTSAVEALEKSEANPGQEFSTPLSKEVPIILTYHPVSIQNDYVTVYPDIYRRYPDFALTIADSLKPYLHENDANLKKIKSFIRMYKGRTFQVSLDSLTSK